MNPNLRDLMHRPITAFFFPALLVAYTIAALFDAGLKQGRFSPVPEETYQPHV